MSNYSRYPQQYGGYSQEQEQTQGYPSKLRSVPFHNSNQEVQFDQDISENYTANKSRKPKVKLLEGNYVLECPVPSNLLSVVPKKDDKEFTHMRYTACTCDPDNFRESKYKLRQELVNRPTELFIAITMYNENEVLFARTFHSVVKNIVHLCSRNRSRMWGNDGWKKIVVCILSDGRKYINQHVLAYLSVIGVYQDGVAKNKIEVHQGGKTIERDVTAHIYEYTTQISITPKIQVKGAGEGIVPIQVIFCLKEKQAKKINSHRWFFNAFGSILNPNICVLLDVGTKPGGTSIYHLWKAFDVDQEIAGACGEIVAMKGKACSNLINPIVAAQNYEYKMANILDKPIESVIGYITVLPGAFSAYRFEALKNDPDGRGPLASYFMGETQQGKRTDVFTANMYLAEDRILCFELVVKRNCHWILKYVKSAYAETDVPDTVPGLIAQRRRWLNGSLFTSVYAICHTFSIWRSNHNLARKILLHIEMIYQTINLIFSWFALGNLFLIFYIFSNTLRQGVYIGSIGLWDEDTGRIIFEALQYVYLLLLLIQFIVALGNRPQDSKWIHIFSITIYAGLMVYLLFAAVWIAYKGISTKGINDVKEKKMTKDDLIHGTLWNLIISAASTYGVYLLASLLFFEPWHMFTSSVQYLLLTPFYINVLNVYAFCNIHDVSWGTREETTDNDLGIVTVSEKGEVEVSAAEQDDINTTYEGARNKLLRHVKETEERQPKTDDYYRSFRTRLVLFWLFSNAALVIGIAHGSLSTNTVDVFQERTNYYMSAIFCSVAGLAIFRFVGSCVFLITGFSIAKFR